MTLRCVTVKKKPSGLFQKPLKRRRARYGEAKAYAETASNYLDNGGKVSIRRGKKWGWLV